MKKIIPYSEYRKIARTFDLLNFEHKDWLWRMIGHTAMVVADKSRDMLHCWESTSRGMGGQSGVQINPLRARLEQYGGRVNVRQIIYPRICPMLPHMALNEVIKRERGKPYPNLKSTAGRIYLANAEIDCGGKLTENIENPAWRFCTDLFVATYRDCGLTIPGINSAEYEPDDMRPGGKFERCLAAGVQLGKEFEIMMD
jgi:hypothetical protein